MLLPWSRPDFNTSNVCDCVYHPRAHHILFIAVLPAVRTRPTLTMGVPVCKRAKNYAWGRRRGFSRPNMRRPRCRRFTVVIQTSWPHSCTPPPSHLPPSLSPFSFPPSSLFSLPGCIRLSQYLLLFDFVAGVVSSPSRSCAALGLSP